ncbi:PBP1 and LysM peptidoglycan-binding domain-containing protein [Luteibaculum oceani]|uniref:LysM peptidoglycan-binding domain-containing protein n=1 Tax=Luteibaculum oceani TaxID=1294296 RepID=A0A5C6VBX5_9FLAO|nr:LysM peptidoglycan-binding domain-containing protein [Luteibaculum oceani]TXC81986.1 LysM peptidoglycan-binding domain-containing protein [Luteibaculum oceani]
MKNVLLTLIAVLCLAISSFGQAERITTINGKKYIIHTVEPGNTLYSISKTYAVDTYFIIQENQFLKEGLKVGQELKIPLARQSKSESKFAPELRGDYLIHEVQKKETLYSLSKKYGIEIKDVIDNNPQAAQGIKVGQQLKIPTNKSTAADKDHLKPAIDAIKAAAKPSKPTKIIHQVEQGETLYSLAKRYGVTMQAIIDANSGLIDGIKAGTSIIIPNKEADDDDESSLPQNDLNNQREEYPKSDKSSSYYENPVQPGFSGYKPGLNKSTGSFKVAILLPFLASEEGDQSDFSRNKIALEFYQGAVLALDSLERLGLNTQVLVYDTKKDAMHVKRLLENPALSDVNLFIGPMFRSPLEQVVEHAERIGAHVVCPVPQSNKVLFNHPNVSKIHVNVFTQASLLGKYTATQHSNAKVIVINKEGQDAKANRLAQNFKKTYFKFLPGGNIFGTDTLATLVTNGYEFPEMESFLDNTRPNIVFTPSSDPVLASGLLTHLKGYSKEYKIQVMGLEPWLGMDEIDTRNKNDLSLTVSSSHYINYEDRSTLQFIKGHRKKFKSDPGEFTHLGFDVTFYYLKGMLQNGTLFLEELNSDTNTTSTKFSMLRISNTSGFENKAAYILSYDNYKIKVLN